MGRQSFFLKKGVVATIGILALMGGFVFINMGMINPISGQVTGNFASNTLSSFSMISVIGILLILCSAVLIIYAIVKK